MQFHTYYKPSPSKRSGIILKSTVCSIFDKGYRFGFNGQEQDDEVSGEGKINTAEFWEYDCRLGRRWNSDPINFIGFSPYSCFLNNPLFFLDSDGDIPWPSCVNSKNVTSHQGWRMHPIQKKQKYHGGMDIAVKSNTAVHTLAQGVVAKVGWDANGYGNYVVVKHKNGYFTLYGHLTKSSVSLNDKVGNGQILGQSGNTGGSTGPHLHLELIKAQSLSGIFSKANKLDPETIPDLQKHLYGNTEETKKEEKIYGIYELKPYKVVVKGSSGNGNLTLRPLQKLETSSINNEVITPIKLTPTK